MAHRYSGTLRISIEFTGKIDRDGRGEYCGNIHIPGQGNWRFTELYSHPEGPYDSPVSYDCAAHAALEFGSYYDRNHQQDVPPWAPSIKIAEAIQEHQERLSEEGDNLFLYPGVSISDTTVVFRSRKAQNEYRDELVEKELRKSKRPKLRVIQGGVHDAA